VGLLIPCDKAGTEKIPDGCPQKLDPEPGRKRREVQIKRAIKYSKIQHYLRCFGRCEDDIPHFMMKPKA
jgi:hypothetical protein